MDKIVTIGMPTRNRVFCIDRVLASISEQSYPKTNIKLVFVDESDDGTYERLVQFRKKNMRNYLDIQILRSQANGYISVARNLCFKNMQGEVMFFWDSDVVAPDKNALRCVVQSLDKTNVAVAGFPYYCENPCLYEKIMQSETELGGMGFTAIKREVFREVGLFNERLKVNEDTDLFARIRTHGMKILFEKGAPCLHLKQERTGKSVRANFSDYRRRLGWCFHSVPNLYEEMIKAGSRSHLLRILYYIALPPVICFWLFNLGYSLVPLIPATFFVGMYILLNLAYHIWKASQNRLWGVVAFFYHMPCGIAISYGLGIKVLRATIKKPLFVSTKYC